MIYNKNRTKPRRKKKKPAKKITQEIKSAKEAVCEEEKILFNKIKRGDNAARKKLLDKYSAWATNIARKYHSLFPNIEISELEAEGNRGLLEAIDRFDPLKRVKFSTYSWFWIIKNIQEYITSSINLIGIPAKVMSDLKMVISEMNDAIKKGASPSLKNISRKLGLEENNVTDMLSDKKNVSTPLSLDVSLDEEDRQEKLADVVEDKKLDSVKKLLDIMDDKKSISTLFAKLSPLEQKVLHMRFGFKSGKSSSFTETGRKLNMLPSKIKDIESIAMIKLKRLISSEAQGHEQD